MGFRSTRGVLHLGALGIGLITYAVPSPASAQLFDTTMILQPKEVEEEQAAKIREFMRAGLAEYRKKNLEGARQAFLQAWGTAHRPDVAAALADVEMKLGRYRDAAEHWDDYLRSWPGDRAEAAARLEECRVHVAAVAVEVEPPGAELEVDGNRTPTGGSGGTIWLDPGPHTLAARVEDRRSVIQQVEVAAGQSLDLRLVVPPAAAQHTALPPAPPLSPPVPASRTDAPHGGLKTRTIVTIGGATLTVAAAALGGWFLLARESAQSEHATLRRQVDIENSEGAQTTGPCTPGPQRAASCDALWAKADEVNRDTNWAVGSFVSAGVLGAATALTYIVWPAGEKRQASRALIITPLSGPGADGLNLTTTF